MEEECLLAQIFAYVSISSDHVFSLDSEAGQCPCNSFAKPYILQDDGQYGRRMQPRIVNGYIISEKLCLLLKESQRASHSKRRLQYHCEWLVARVTFVAGKFNNTDHYI